MSEIVHVVPLESRKSLCGISLSLIKSGKAGRHERV
jgi:hypothetical protein